MHLYSVDGATGRYRVALNLRLNIRSVRHTGPTTVPYLQCRIEATVVLLIISVFCVIAAFYGGRSAYLQIIPRPASFAYSAIYSTEKSQISH